MYISETMAREINPMCDFIFRSIRTGLPTDTGDVELTIRMVKGIYTYHKDHTSESTVFSPWSRTVTPFPSLRRKIKAYQEQNDQASVWNGGHTMSYHPPQTQPKWKCTPGKTQTRWSNHRNRFNLIKTEHFNMLNWETEDYKKLDLVEPTPSDFVLGPKRDVHIVNTIAHTHRHHHQTGPAKTGMETRPKLGNNAPCLTLTNLSNN